MTTPNLFSANHYQRMSFGDFGFRILSATGTATSVVGEKFGAITILENSRISLTSNAEGGDNTLTNFDINEGHTMVGNFTSITVVQGSIICYLRR